MHFPVMHLPVFLQALEKYVDFVAVLVVVDDIKVVELVLFTFLP